MKKFYAAMLAVEGTGRQYVNAFFTFDTEEEAIEEAKKRANDSGGTYVVLKPVSAFRPPAPPINVEEVQFED